MSSTTTANTITALSSIFAIEGYLKTMVSDNGPQLRNAFEEFCKHHGIKHITAAFHPASYGLAERSDVQILSQEEPQRRFTPNSNGKSPAELIHGRPVRTVLSQLFEQPVDAKQSVTKYVPNQMVYARNYSEGKKWIEGIIDRPIGKMLFMVRTTNGYIKRHFNHHRKTSRVLPFSNVILNLSHPRAPHHLTNNQGKNNHHDFHPAYLFAKVVVFAKK
ncbi:uncharacterized protein K02A2.6-like [Drosophila rhopaloa]|uniref:Integrase catalytic domain-containing protein n=1 Tax=Drosophila rhopaloa TaxID=1041015 RepID=A0ABM5J1P7_DRORH|nr:uncharacterized protein K02A2.6-like [Drosophila rhopaloa]